LAGNKLVKQSFEQRLKRLGLSNPIDNQVTKEYASQFAGKPFWVWDKKAHEQEWNRTYGHCCYNHIISLPKKNGEPKGLFDYQYKVISELERSNLICVFKARSTGITELMLRYMGWLCLKDDQLKGSNMIIISAPSEELSISFIRRLKAHHEPYLQFDTKERLAILNGVRLETMPSHNLRRLRGITNVSFLLAEESDYWNPSEESELLPTILPLTQKNNQIKIALVSTPGRLGGLMHQLHMSPQSTIRFKKIYIPYTDAVGKIFTEEEIQLAKKQPNFEREFNLKWGVGMGNVFAAADIQKAIDLGLSYANPTYNPDCTKREYPYSIYSEGDSVLGVDPGAAGSAFAICGLQIWNGHVHVFAAEQYHRPDEDEMVERILQLWHGTGRSANIFVDAANQAFIKKMKSALKPWGEQVDIDWHLQYLRRHDLAGKNDINIPSHMICCPVAFNAHGARLLQTAATYMQRHWVAIHPDFAELIESLQAARTKENATNDWTLDKTGSHSMDLLDAYRLGHYSFKLEDS
jgi:hypothetical protein